jgi:ABC-type branched-subunit amino acid transport system substrate-binding protein
MLPPGPTRLGVMLPLSGPNADLGQQLWDAAVLSLFDSGRDDIALVPIDTQGTALGGAAAAEEAIAAGSSAVVGPLFTASVGGARPALAAGGLHGVALSNNRNEARAPFFLIGNHPETQIDALAAYLASEGRYRIKLLGPDDRYLQLLHERLVLLDKAGKIQLVDTRLYKASADYTEIAKNVRAITLYDRRTRALNNFTAIFADAWEKFEDPDEALHHAFEKLATRMEKARLHFASLTPQDAEPSPMPQRRSWGITEAEYSEALSDLLPIYYRHLKTAATPRDAMTDAIEEFERRETLGKPDFDAVLLPIGSKPLLVIAPMFAYFNAAQPDVWIVGTDIWESVARYAPKDLRGSRYVTAATPEWQRFQTRFKDAFGREPGPLAATAYDAIAVAIDEKATTGQISLAPDFLLRTDGFQGINGFFRFLPAGDNSRTLQIVKLGEKASETVYTWSQDQQLADQPPALSVGEEKIAPTSPTEAPVQPTPPTSMLVLPDTKNS